MSFVTQISSIFIPKKIWYEGTNLLPSLPPLYLPAQDAIAIEKRAEKDVNIRLEKRRYLLCCERMQGIASELILSNSILPEPFVWSLRLKDSVYKSDAMFSLTASIMKWLVAQYDRGLWDKKIYTRVSTNFFPPEHSKMHYEFLEQIKNHPRANTLFKGASKTYAYLTPEDCEDAFKKRSELLKTAVEQDYGIVDVYGLV